MKTVATDKLPEITWERGDYVESHPHTIVFIANGYSEDGREWSAAWNVTDGEMVDIEDIECEYTPISKDAELWEMFMMELEFATVTLEDGTIIESTNTYTND
jgi:hypothetical protein